MNSDLLKRLETVNKRIDAVLDTDAYNEIDDQFALSYMLAYSDRINVKAIYAAPFWNYRSTSPEDGMLKSHNEIVTLLKLCGRTDLIGNTYKGSKTYLPDEENYVESPAARHLAALSDGYTSENPLYVVAIGAITNIASALLMNPSIKDKIVVIWLGGNALDWPNNYEFNMRQDVAAARVVFNSGCALVMLPAKGVVSAFTVSEAEFDRWFIGKNALSDYLAGAAKARANQYAAGQPWTRVIWDVTGVAWLVNDNDRFMESRIISAPIPEYDLHYSHDFMRHPARYIWNIKRDALLWDLVKKLVGAERQ